MYEENPRNGCVVRTISSFIYIFKIRHLNKNEKEREIDALTNVLKHLTNSINFYEVKLT